MFCVIDDNNHVVAFHEDEEVVKTYVEMIKRSKDKTYHIATIKDKKIKKIKDFEDLYLVRYGETYIQTEYLTYVELATNSQIDSDNKLCKEILFRILETQNLDKDDKKTIMKCIKVIDNIIEENETYTPSLSELRTLKDDFESYMHNMDYC